MCRTGGHRCKGSTASSRATQATRQQRSRARSALRKAKASGDADAITAAQQRLTAANAAHQTAREKAMSHNDNAADQRGDVTNIVHGENHGQQHDVINGGVTIHGSGRITIGDNTGGQHGDVTTERPVGHHSPQTNAARTQDRARYQQDRARYQAERERYQAEHAAGTSAPTGDGFNVHTGPRHHESGGTGPVHITDDNGNTILQAGNVNGGIWVNGKRVG